jgi:hypothetical protein
MQTIVLTKDAASHVRRKGPSDIRLKEMLLSNSSQAGPTITEYRWMAAYVLEMCGYTLIHPDGEPDVNKPKRKPGK